MRLYQKPPKDYAKKRNIFGLINNKIKQKSTNVHWRPPPRKSEDSASIRIINKERQDDRHPPEIRRVLGILGVGRY